MNPELKFHSFIISVTTALVFLVWISLNKIITDYPFFSVILSGLISLGIYRSLTLLVITLLKKYKVIKKFFLGPRYMEGTWIGFFVGNKNQIRYFIEIFEQDLSRTVIRGRVFRDDGVYHGSWIAEDATIDPIRGKLSYRYETDAIGNTFVNPGIASFSLERTASHKPPIRLIGFSSDLFNPHKLMAIEEKESDKLLLDSEIALEKAKKIYEKYRQHVPLEKKEDNQSQ